MQAVSWLSVCNRGSPRLKQVQYQLRLWDKALRARMEELRAHTKDEPAGSEAGAGSTA